MHEAIVKFLESHALAPGAILPVALDATGQRPDPCGFISLLIFLTHEVSTIYNLHNLQKSKGAS